MKDNSLIDFITDIRHKIEKLKKEKVELYSRIEVLEIEKKMLIDQMKNQNSFNSLNEVGFLREKIDSLCKEVDLCIRLVNKN